MLFTDFRVTHVLQVAMGETHVVGLGKSPYLNHPPTQYLEYNCYCKAEGFRVGSFSWNNMHPQNHNTYPKKIENYEFQYFI